MTTELNDKMKKAIVASFEARGCEIEFTVDNVVIKKEGKAVNKISVKEYLSYFRLISP